MMMGEEFHEIKHTLVPIEELLRNEANIVKKLMMLLTLVLETIGCDSIPNVNEELKKIPYSEGVVVSESPLA